MNIVFMGTPDFAVPSLKKLIEKFNVTAVFTQPDKPKGRGKKLGMSAVKEVAVQYDIPVYQPEKLRKDIEALESLKNINPDFIVVVAYGQILTKEVLDTPKYGCINLHASLLPKYRGAAPINWAIINGEKESGNTTMFMDIGLDTGDMLLKSHVDITEDMTAGELHDILMEDGSELLVRTLEGIEDKTIKREKQGDSTTAYAAMLNKDMAKIDWNLSNREIKNLIRGLNPWPIAYTQYEGKNMKIYEASILDENSNYNPGYVIDVCNEGIKVACKEGSILLTNIQFPGGKPMKVSEYIRGHKLNKGITLGE
ncbi:methionyl-tRNA formyltransferase [Clostridium carboxidivorans P7]|uniref:Methionyl-tRNA formyltransferase n=1 Tax=Clostridium carboxidivorans P7 TaxID=536227 RepID=C6PUW8_9CLOT|nr:methionyl-tRNA formyltransferase [Clostridium carboxidivorans]AKN29414.1 methionyl-tRNA formyltransferase [Clostridium carboxidivorans P7]EET86945.1 methionyl-tRNA formyltransferase [Clostridium carboxidivorans P7]EFG89670.1 methionyl-tRNA formyltransferase [Clostridium carboxidivorans P7]